MANRKKRLEKEQAIRDTLNAHKAALKNAKKRQKQFKKLSWARQYVAETLSNQYGVALPKWQVFMDKCLRVKAIRERTPELLPVLVRYRAKIERPFEAWRPGAVRRRRDQLGDLLRFLFARYEMPAFLLRELSESGLSDENAIALFFHIAEGKNPRHFRWALPVTKAAAHWFLQAPAHFEHPTAMAWAQARAEGFDARKAFELAGIFKTYFSGQARLWDDFLVFATKYPSLTLLEYNEIAQFVRQQSQGSIMLCLDWGDMELQAMFPHYSIRKATLSGLQRRMAEQAAEITYWKKHYHQKAFPVGPLPNGEIDIESRRYSIALLENGKALVQESRQMRHCVNTYIRYCINGYSFIYSVSCLDGASAEKVGTIEIEKVEDGFSLVQFKAKCNNKPAAEAFEALRAWLGSGPLKVSWDGERW